MGILDNLRGLVGGSAKEFVDIPLEAGEQVVTDEFGCLLRHGMAWKGGQLRLTNRRMLIRPWNTADIAALLSWGLSKSGAPAPGVALVGTLQAANTAEQFDQDQITSVRAGGGPSLFRPPTVILEVAGGRRVELGVLASPTTPNISKKNIAPRDRLLTALITQLNRA